MPNTARPSPSSNGTNDTSLWSRCSGAFSTCTRPFTNFASAHPVLSHVGYVGAGLTATGVAAWSAGVTPSSVGSFLCNNPLSTAKSIGSSMYNAANWSDIGKTALGAAGAASTLYGVGMLGGDAWGGARDWWKKPGEEESRGRPNK